MSWITRACGGLAFKTRTIPKLPRVTNISTTIEGHIIFVRPKQVCLQYWKRQLLRFPFRRGSGQLATGCNEQNVCFVVNHANNSESLVQLGVKRRELGAALSSPSVVSYVARGKMPILIPIPSISTSPKEFTHVDSALYSHVALSGQVGQVEMPEAQ